MKKVYNRPEMLVETYEANEYAAGCGDKGTVYKFTCDAYKASLLLGWNFGGKVYLEKNNNGMYDGGDRYLGTYHSCQETHEAATTAEFSKGWFKPYTNLATAALGIADGDPIEVIIWRGDNNDNIHCTTNLNMSTWETTKS